MKLTRLLLVLAVAAVGVGIAGYAYFVSHTFSARAKPSAVEAFIARRLRRLVTTPAVRDRPNPLQATPIALAEARDHFADHCAFCHGNDGTGKTAVNEGLYPPAPDLRDSWTQALTDGEIFAIIRDGIRFTGMPGWGGEDEENWKLVLFIRHLPKLTQEELELMKKAQGVEVEHH